MGGCGRARARGHSARRRRRRRRRLWAPLVAAARLGVVVGGGGGRASSVCGAMATEAAATPRERTPVRLGMGRIGARAGAQGRERFRPCVWWVESGRNSERCPCARCGVGVGDHAADARAAGRMFC